MIEMRRSCEMTSLIQGGSRPMGGYQTLMGPSSPAPAPPSPAQAPAWQYQSVMPKQEPMDHDARNDSGMDSGSEILPYSPDSNRSGNLGMDYLSRTSQVTTTISPSSYYTNPIMRHMRYNSEHNPLTPPDSEPMVSPGISFGEDKTDVTRQRSTSMTCSTDEETEDPIKRLEKIFSSSRKSSECSIEDKSENDINQYTDQGLRTPKVNSHGKVKKFKCKQCGFLAYTKVDFWNHSREHIKPDKQLTCPKCPFVTEYKHHLEYHLRNHEGKKPHKCPKCPYTCVNKSMLNSHSKSHSNIYQYRCSECSYASKYCHSLKLHSRKYNHEPGVALDEGGSPNPRQIIDVYGTRRGPKVKKQESQSGEDTPAMLPFPLNQMLLNASSQMQMPFPGFPFFNGFQGAVPNPLLLQNLDRLMRQQREAFPVPGVPTETPPEVSPAAGVPGEPSADFSPVPNVSAEPSPDFSSMPDVSEEAPSFEENDGGVLDLSKPNNPSPKNRRKGPAFKLAPNNDNSSEEEDEDGGETTVMYSTVEAIQGEQSDEEVSKTVSLKCQFCDICFGDPIIHTLHMGLHGYDNPFKCNMCGQESKDKVSFYLHLVRVPHP